MTASREDRRRALRSLLALEQPLDGFITGLAAFGWDCDEELVTLRKAHVVLALQRFQQGEVVAGDLERWADAVEGRDDIGLDDTAVSILKDVIFALANPSLQGGLTVELAGRWISRLSGSGN